MADETSRLNALLGDSASGVFTLFRSVSSLNPRLANDTGPTRRLHWSLVLPEARHTHNSLLPFSLNDGALWTGRGTSWSLTTGVRAEWGPVRLFVLPEFTYAANDSFPPPSAPPNPLPPASRRPYSSPWHANGQSIDLPYRFGNQRIQQLWPGQSSLSIDWRGAVLGISTENEWWGPGIRNALIVSNNAPGFEHFFARPARPLRTRFGFFDARWIVGALQESRYFDYDPANDMRSVSMLGLTWTSPSDSGLTVGMARSVFAPAANRRHVLRSAFDVFRDVGHPNARPYLDSVITPGRDQLISLFFRWAFPKDGFETYAEWARTEIPRSVRDFLLYPNHTQGYTLGLQWLGEPGARNGRLRAQGEFTFLEQSTTYRYRDIGSWYTSRAAVQGYTNRGQSLGAAIGPGSASQFIGLDYVRTNWRLGYYFNRIQWLEDAHSQQDYPDIPGGTRGWCEHDVSLLNGLRGAARTRIGNFSFDYTTGWRLNVFFENPGPCPISFGRDQRNKSFQLTFSPSR